MYALENDSHVLSENIECELRLWNATSCGLELPLLKSIEGRTLDIVKTSNGNSVGGTFWTLLFRSSPGIAAFQVIQESARGITVKYVKQAGIEPPLKKFSQKIREKCGHNFEINFKEEKEIPKTKSGKTRFVISKI